MTYSENKRKYNVEYDRKTYRRVPLNLHKDYFEQMRAFLEKKGVPVNTFIRNAIDEKLKKEGFEYIPGYFPDKEKDS